MKKQGCFLLVLTVGLTGCNSYELGELNKKVEEVTQKEVLEIWTYYDGWESVVEKFKNIYDKDIEVKVEVFPNQDYVDSYLKGLTEDEGPDIMVIDSNDFGQFNTLDAFENLEQKPYEAKRYKEGFDPKLWNSSKSFTEDKLIVLPMGSAPTVTYYRADIMEDYGFPSDPAELGKYLEDPNNWLAIGEALAKDDIYITQWGAEPVNIVGTSMPYFDKEFNFIRNNSKFIEAVSTCKKVKQKGLIPYKDLWLEEGQELLRNNQMAMVYLGTWGASQLEQWVPEQKGLWHATRLPFDTYGLNNSTLMAIPSNGSNKEAAWAFIEHYIFGEIMPETIGTIPSYIPKREKSKKLDTQNTFLGGQEEQKLYTQIIEQCEYYLPTPLDNMAKTIVVQQLIAGLNAGYTAEKIIHNIEKQIDRQLSQNKDILKD